MHPEGPATGRVDTRLLALPVFKQVLLKSANNLVEVHQLEDSHVIWLCRNQHFV
jgi:hypothetical protein